MWDWHLLRLNFGFMVSGLGFSIQGTRSLGLNLNLDHKPHTLNPNLDPKPLALDTEP